MHSLSFLFLWQDLAINRIQIRNKIVSTQLKTLANVQIIVASNVLHQFEVEVIPRSKKPSCLCVATYSNSQCTLFCTCLRLRSPPLHTLPDPHPAYLWYPLCSSPTPLQQSCVIFSVVSSLRSVS